MSFQSLDVPYYHGPILELCCVIFEGGLIDDIPCPREYITDVKPLVLTRAEHFGYMSLDVNWIDLSYFFVSDSYHLNTFPEIVMDLNSAYECG